ncbi:MAG: hypothetical protein NZM13_12760, partial [Cyclobacteriaceae bacterium]|nr:hypothetical protein [Cyclobacteriaceae bacterium]
NPLPSAPTISTPPAICAGQTASFTMPSSAGIVYDIYDAPTGGSIVSGGSGLAAGATFTTPALSSNTFYYVEARNSSTGCKSATRTTVTVTVNPLPSAPTVSAPPAICSGQSTTITPSAGGANYRFYSTSTGGTALHTGTSFTTPGLTSTTTYHVSSISAQGCESSTRTLVTVTVNPLPSIQINTPQPGQSVSPGTTSTTLNYTNKVEDPDKYDLTWPSGGANNVTNAPLLPNQIVIEGITSIPGAYVGSLVVKKSSTGCNSNPINVEIFVSNDNSSPEIRLKSGTFMLKNTSSLEVKYEIIDNESGIQEAKISVGNAYDSNFFLENQNFQSINGNERVYTITSIPAENKTGLRIMVYARNGANLVRTIKNFIPVKYDNTGLTIDYNAFGKSISNYRIISIPLKLEKNKVKDIFSDNLGKYNPYQWRLFKYSNRQTSELNEESSIESGFGYWFISAKETIIDTGPGYSTGSYDSSAKISITEGWNLIGNPYLFNLKWSDVQAANPGLSLGSLKVYRTGSFTNSDRLLTFEGAFVFANNAGTLTFPALKNNSVNSGRLENETSVLRYNTIDGKDWEVRFTVVNSMIRNELSGFGMSPEANEGYDLLDDFTLPHFSDYLEVNHQKKHHGISYSKDIVPPAEEKEWTFTITSSKSEETQLSWDNFYFNNQTKDLILWHQEKKLYISMSEINNYHFTTPATFTVYYADKEKLKNKFKEEQLIIFNPYPNPATDRLYLPVYLTEKLSEIPVTISLLSNNSLQTFFSEKFLLQSGYRNIEWNLNELKHKLASGLYILQVRTPFTTENKKVIINHSK